MGAKFASFLTVILAFKMFQTKWRLKLLSSLLPLLIYALGKYLCLSYEGYITKPFRAFLKVNSGKEYFIEQRRATGRISPTFEQFIDQILPNNRSETDGFKSQMYKMYLTDIPWKVLTIMLQKSSILPGPTSHQMKTCLTKQWQLLGRLSRMM